MKEPRILVVASGYNCAPFVAECIRSIKEQRYHNFDYLIVDDGSTDATLEIIKAHAPHGKIIELSQRHGTVKAHDYGIRARDADVIVWANLDDTLLPGALERVAKEYAPPPGCSTFPFWGKAGMGADDCAWLTYGNYIDYDGRVCYDAQTIDYPADVHNRNDYRQVDFKFCHLRSFRKDLYMHLTDQDLYVPELKASPDFNLWTCLLELAGHDHIKPITDVLYRYNNMNPLNVLRTHTAAELQAEREFVRTITPKQKLISL